MNDSGFFLLDLNTGGYAPINEDSLERNRELAAHTPGYRVVTKNELPHGPNGAKASAPVRAEIAPPAPATQATDPLLAAFEHDPRRHFVNWRLESPSQKIPIVPHTGRYGSSTDPTTWGSAVECFTEFLTRPWTMTSLSVASARGPTRSCLTTS